VLIANGLELRLQQRLDQRLFFLGGLARDFGKSLLSLVKPPYQPGHSVNEEAVTEPVPVATGRCTAELTGYSAGNSAPDTRRLRSGGLSEHTAEISKARRASARRRRRRRI
jgi:hypothetical protein